GIHGLDDQRTDHGHRDREASAQQRGAADDHGQNGIEFQPQPGIVGVGAADVGGHHNAGYGGAKPGQTINQHQQHAAANARQRGGGAVDPDRLHEQPNGAAAHQ